MSCQLNIIYYLINKFIFLCLILDYKNLKLKNLIDSIAIDFLFSKNFASMKDIRRNFNLMMNLSKLTFYKMIMSGVVAKLCPNFYLHDLS